PDVLVVDRRDVVYPRDDVARRADLRRRDRLPATPAVARPPEREAVHRPAAITFDEPRFADDRSRRDVLDSPRLLRRRARGRSAAARSRTRRTAAVPTAEVKAERSAQHDQDHDTVAPPACARAA